MPTAQNVCGPLCGYTIEELRVKSPWSAGGSKVSEQVCTMGLERMWACASSLCLEHILWWRLECCA